MPALIIPERLRNAGRCARREKNWPQTRFANFRGGFCGVVFLVVDLPPGSYYASRHRLAVCSIFSTTSHLTLLACATTRRRPSEEQIPFGIGGSMHKGLVLLWLVFTFLAYGNAQSVHHATHMVPSGKGWRIPLTPDTAPAEARPAPSVV